MVSPSGPRLPGRWDLTAVAVDGRYRGFAAVETAWQIVADSPKADRPEPRPANWRVLGIMTWPTRDQAIDDCTYGCRTSPNTSRGRFVPLSNSVEGEARSPRKFVRPTKR